MPEPQQSFENHTRIIPAFHYLVFGAFTLDLAGPSPGDMVVAFGALWTTASEDAALFRIALE